MNLARPGLRRAIALAGLLLVISACWQAGVDASLPLAGPVSGVSGRLLYFTRIGPDGSAQVERILQDGSKRRVVVVVVKEAENPTVSTKGPIAFVRTRLPSYAQTLLIVDANGRGARPLVRSSTFLTLMFPQFSPDGSRIVFAASGGPGPQPTRRSDRPGLAVAAWPAPPVAWAHGLPMDLWMINTDGTGLRPLTELGEDDPASVWSPDGRWIAFTGALGLYLLDVGRGKVIRIHDEGGGVGSPGSAGESAG